MTASKPKTANTRPRDAAAGVAPKRPKIDWEAVERDYRTGKHTLRELEAQHYVSYAEISRKAKKLGWTKDLREVIKQATNAALLRESITTAQKDVTETILVAAEIGKYVILGHRTGLNRLTEVKIKLLAQIEQAVENMVDLAEVIDMVRNPDKQGMDRANDALRKAMERGALVDDLKKLADVDEKVRKGEREAFSLDDMPDPDSAPDRTMSDAELAVRLEHLFDRVKR